MAKIAVLIIDDSVTIRAMMEQVFLNHPKFDSAGIARNVQEARTMMQKNSYDVVTLDLAMPGVGGLEFLNELAKCAHAPIVVVSSSTTCGGRAEAEAISHGAVCCFDKAHIISDVRGFIRILIKAAATKKSGPPANPFSPCLGQTPKLLN